MTLKKSEPTIELYDTKELEKKLLARCESALPENIIDNAVKDNPALKEAIISVFTNARLLGQHEGRKVVLDIARRSIENGAHEPYIMDIEKDGKLYHVYIYAKENIPTE
jgi:hypothetical protein